MWIFLPNAMLSIVQKKNDREAGTLTVRARAPGDIEAVFPEAQVVEGGGTDYRFRASLPRERVAAVMAETINTLDWSNFKAQVKENDRHHAYMDCWIAMYRFQEKSAQRK